MIIYNISLIKRRSNFISMSKTYKELIGENHKKERVPFVWDSIPEEEARIAG